jgi:hypothetical protein
VKRFVKACTRMKPSFKRKNIPFSVFECWPRYWVSIKTISNSFSFSPSQAFYKGEKFEHPSEVGEHVPN